MNSTSYTSLLLSILLSITTSFAFANNHVSDSGTWTKKYQKIHGAWQIEEVEGVHYLVLDEKFKTRKAPDLKFVLSNNSVANVNGKNAMQDALVIENLKSNKGAQRYRLPDNFKDYSTLLLHCEQFSKLWGATTLTH